MRTFLILAALVIANPAMATTPECIDYERALNNAFVTQDDIHEHALTCIRNADDSIDEARCRRTADMHRRDLDESLLDLRENCDRSRR